MPRNAYELPERFLPELLDLTKDYYLNKWINCPNKFKARIYKGIVDWCWNVSKLV